MSPKHRSMDHVPRDVGQMFNTVEKLSTLKMDQPLALDNPKKEGRSEILWSGSSKFLAIKLGRFKIMFRKISKVLVHL